MHSCALTLTLTLLQLTMLHACRFDGDGMIHGVRIKAGKAHYCNHYVQTAKLQEEKAAGRPLHLKLGDAMGPHGAAAVLLHDVMKWAGVYGRPSDGQPGHKELGVWRDETANTSLVYHAGQLLALHEGDQPYVVS